MTVYTIVLLTEKKFKCFGLTCLPRWNHYGAWRATVLAGTPHGRWSGHSTAPRGDRSACPRWSSWNHPLLNGTQLTSIGCSSVLHTHREYLLLDGFINAPHQNTWQSKGMGHSALDLKVVHCSTIHQCAPIWGRVLFSLRASCWANLPAGKELISGWIWLVISWPK